MCFGRSLAFYFCSCNDPSRGCNERNGFQASLNVIFFWEIIFNVFEIFYIKICVKIPKIKSASILVLNGYFKLILPRKIITNLPRQIHITHKII
jgi:hypothetical protein